MHTRLDCVLIGYNDVPFSRLLSEVRHSREVSGGYRYLMANSVPFRGERLNYPDLLNKAREAATGEQSNLHVARLPSLGIFYLASYLRRRGFNADFVNFFNHETDKLRDLLSHRPSCVAITTTFYYEARPIREIADFVKEHSPETRIIVGGPHVFNVCTDYPPKVQDSLLAKTGGDIFVNDSQGEATLARICEALRSANTDLSRIPNLIYRSNSQAFERTPRQPESNDMNSEAVDWRLFDPYSLAPSVQTRTARSCAYKCSFCRYPVAAGTLSLTDLEVVEHELTYLSSIGVKQVLFIDDTFNIPLQRFKEICRMMIRRGFGIDWYSYFRCANADLEAFDLLAESGCKGVFLGIESGDNGVLRAMNKVATIDKYSRGIERLKRRNIMSYASFIIGHPGETVESAARTIEFVDEIQPTFYCLATFFSDPKVPIAAQAEEFGLTGHGYAWSHNTMDWLEASDIVDEGYRSIQRSTISPLYGFDLWTIAYLIGLGSSVDQIQRFLGSANRLLTMGSMKSQEVVLEDELIEAAGNLGAT